LPSSLLDRSDDHTGYLPSELLDMMQPPSWWAQASCRGMGTAVFFPDSTRGEAAAKAICRPCPVRSKCLAAALRAQPRVKGVFGGTTERERLRMLRQPKGPTP
jgi:WhiB family redox-sensing transcriptional regulator